MRKQLYIDIREQLKTIKDENNEQLFKHVDMFNRQLEFAGQENSFYLPAIFVEFGEMNWRTLGNRIQECEFYIRLHVLTEWIAGNANEGDAMDAFDAIDKVVAAMQGFSTQYMSGWMRKTSITDHDHGEIVENIEEYVCNLRDFSAVKQYVQVQEVGIKINKD
jgi:hypothetical protein